MIVYTNINIYLIILLLLRNILIEYSIFILYTQYLRALVLKATRSVAAGSPAPTSFSALTLKKY